MRRHARGRRAPRSPRARSRVQGRELNSLAPLDQAIRRTRRNAWISPSFAVVVFAVAIVWRNPVMVIPVIFGVIGLVMFVRRMRALRRSGPFVTALLDRPDQIVSIEQSPKKLGPRQRPVLLEIVTKSGVRGDLALDQNRVEDDHALVQLLHERSPDAVIVYPTMTVAKTQR